VRGRVGLAPFAMLFPLLLIAGCGTQRGAANDTSWLDESAFRACLGVKVPMETIRDPSFKRGTVSLQIELLPSGRIASAAIIAGSGNAAMDEYLQRRLNTMQCGPIANVDSSEPYSVILDLTIEVER